MRAGVGRQQCTSSGNRNSALASSGAGMRSWEVGGFTQQGNLNVKAKTPVNNADRHDVRPGIFCAGVVPFWTTLEASCFRVPLCFSIQLVKGRSVDVTISLEIYLMDRWARGLFQTA